LSELLTVGLYQHIDQSGVEVCPAGTGSYVWRCLRAKEQQVPPSMLSQLHVQLYRGPSSSSFLGQQRTLRPSARTRL